MHFITMEKLLGQSLQLLGLSRKEIKFFITCFTIGPATVQEIQHKARLERSTAYLLAQELLEKGFLAEDFRNYKKTLRTIESKDILRLLASKQRVLGRSELALKERLSELDALYQASDIRPKVRVFQGKKGLIDVQTDILSAQKEIFLWSNQQTESRFFTQAYHDQFISTRLKRNLFINVLAVNNAEGITLQENDTKFLRETRLLPSQIFFSAETYIYDNRVAILDYKKDIIGILIESEEIAQMHRAMFFAAWESK